MVKPYTFDDLTAAMNAVVPHDWQDFFSDRLNSTRPQAPLGGIERAGWRIVYRDSMNSMMKALEDRDKRVDLRFSLGILLSENGEMIDVVGNSPAARAGLAPNMKLVAVNGRKFSKEVVRDALRSSTTTTVPLELLVQNVDYFKTYSVDYHGGERYPYLERDSSKIDLLSLIIKPLTATTQAKESRR